MMVMDDFWEWYDVNAICFQSVYWDHHYDHDEPWCDSYDDAWGNED